MKTKIVLIILALIALSIVGKACGYIGKVENVVAQEIDPAVLLKKYSWFKDASASLDKKIADIGVYESRLRIIQNDSTKTRTDKEQMYIWMSECAGVKASYNQLASEYNSQMSKINWAFCNVGELPKGATEPLPREYKPYIDN